MTLINSKLTPININLKIKNNSGGNFPTYSTEIGSTTTYFPGYYFVPVSDGTDAKATYFELSFDEIDGGKKDISNDVQTLIFSGTPSTPSTAYFTLTFNGQTTKKIYADGVDTYTIFDALADLSNIQDNVFVDEINYTPKTITAVASTNSSGGAGSTHVTYTTGSSHELLVGQTVDITGFDPSGYNVTNGVITNVTTNTFTVLNGTAAGVNTYGQVALDGSRFVIQFINELANLDQPLITVTTTSFSPATVDIVQTIQGGVVSDKIDFSEYVAYWEINFGDGNKIAQNRARPTSKIESELPIVIKHHYECEHDIPVKITAVDNKNRKIYYNTIVYARN